MTDGGDIKVKDKPINVRSPIPLPAFINLNGRRMKTKLAARDKISGHQANGWVALTWKQMYKVTKLSKSPAYQHAYDPSKKRGGNEWAELRPNMFAMVKDAEIIAEENRRAKEKDERRRHVAALNSVEKINRLSRNTTGEGGNVAYGNVKTEAEGWAGVPEGKSMDEEKLITGKTPEE